MDGPGWRVRFREIGSRDQADPLRGVYLETPVPAGEGLGRGEFYWHEVIGTPVRGTDGTDLGVVQDIYRIGETEVFAVGGGAVAPFDLPAVRAFIRIFAPRRGEIVVDAESLDLRPAKSKVSDPSKPKAPRRRSRKPTVDADGRTVLIRRKTIPEGGWIATHEDITDQKTGDTPEDCGNCCNLDRAIDVARVGRRRAFAVCQDKEDE